MSEQMPPEFEKFKLGVWVKEIEPGYGSNVCKKYMVSKEPWLSRCGNYWEMYVAKSLSKRAMNHYRRCEDFELCDPPNQIPARKITLTLTREQAEAIAEELDELWGYIKQPLGDLYQQIEEKLK